MKTYREKYFENIHIEKKLDAAGKAKTTYVYHGVKYYWSNKKGLLHQEDIRRIKLVYSICILLSIFCYVLAGADSNAVTTDPIVSVIALLSLVALIFLIYGVVCFCAKGSYVIEPDYSTAKYSIVVPSVIFSVLMLVCCIISALIGIRTEFSLCARSFICYLLSCICSAAVFIMHRQIHLCALEEDT